MFSGERQGAAFYRMGEEGLYHLSLSDCTWPEAVIGMGAGGSPLPFKGSGGIIPGDFILFVSVHMCNFKR